MTIEQYAHYKSLRSAESLWEKIFGEIEAAERESVKLKQKKREERIKNDAW